MKRFSCFLCFAVLLCLCAFSQNVPKYYPDGQPPRMQYFKPVSPKQFVGDCIPFYKDGTYYLYWLLDEGHHSSLNGLGAHQWCLSTTEDLINWKHYPVVIGIDEDWEKSICTGSVAFDGKQFYEFYATRLINGEGKVNEQLSYALSRDGIHFVKQKPNPFYSSAPGYSSTNFRDPKVVIDEDGVFHLFVTSNKENSVMQNARGALVHLSSRDLKNWTVNEPLVSGQRFEPECPDYFCMGTWWYIVFGQAGDTYYLKSRNRYGPWEYPSNQVLVEQWANVVKTARFKGGRRIAAGWIPSRDGDKDNGGERFGGNILFRELYQLENGDLASKWPLELIPPTGEALPLRPVAKENAVVSDDADVFIDAAGAAGSCIIQNLPKNCRITMTVTPDGNCKEFGALLRACSGKPEGYELAFSPNTRRVTLQDAFIEAVDGLDRAFTLDIILYEDFIDVCIDEKRCIVNRLIERKGDQLWLFCRCGKVSFSDIRVCSIK